MILGYRDDAARAIHVGEETKAARRFAVAVRKVACRTLDLIGAAAEIRDLAVPPGNRLEQLRGDLEGFYNIRVNDQCLITFKFEAGNASHVQLIDCH